jgi:hypothetical protein
MVKLWKNTDKTRKSYLPMNNMTQHKGMDKMRQWITAASIWCIAACGIVSCGDMTDDYKQFQEGGEFIYPAKADSVEAHPGKNRIELQWLILSDPSVTSATIYWNAKRNSQTVPITRTPGAIDTIKVIVDNLEEGIHTFEIYTFNASGDKSVAVEVMGTVYGDRYEASLLSEFYSLHYDTEKGGFITWSSLTENLAGNEVRYTTNAGKTATVFVEKGDTLFTLPDFDHVSPVTYRTAYLPPNAVDTFYTVGSSPIDLTGAINVAVNKPATASSVNGANPPENAVNGDTGTATTNRYVSISIPVNGPQWIAIDLEKELAVSSVKLYCQSAFSAFQFQKEVDGVWVDIITETANASATYTKTFPDTPAKNVRLYVTAVSGSELVRLYEIEIFVKFIYLL